MNRFDKGLSNGSMVIFGIVMLLDVVLANIVYAVITYLLDVPVPVFLQDNYPDAFVAVTLAAIIGVTIFPPIIHRHRVGTIEVVTRVFKMVLVQSLCLMIIVRSMVDFSQGVMRLSGIFFGIYLVATLVVRFMERLLLKYIRKAGHNHRSVVLVGSDPIILTLYNELMSSASVGYRVIGYYANHKIEKAPKELAYLGTRAQMDAEIESGQNPFVADVVLYSQSLASEDAEVNALINYCDKNVIQFYIVPRIYSNYSMSFTPMAFGDYTFFTNHTNNINRLDNRIVKRLFDIVFSLIVCICLLPVVPLIWLIIKIQSPGPMLFAQDRTGLNGETFRLYKFRSMHVNTDADRLQATKDDPRKFAFGDFMRKTNIDELPQFYNVLKGDMSVVGPRPHMLYHTDIYSNVISKYMVRHFSKPGITGWAQVTGCRGETSELWQMEERVKRDIWYNENWSVALDLRIIARTVTQMFVRDEKAY